MGEVLAKGSRWPAGGVGVLLDRSPGNVLTGEVKMYFVSNRGCP